jgi:hypothetical protein
MNSPLQHRSGAFFIHAIIHAMQTPAGQECQYFYGDYYRGRNREECRLLAASSPSSNWSSDLCFTCPVPGIIQANACQSMELNGTVHRPFPFIKRRVKITAYCTKCQCDVAEPHVGCGQCHILPSIFSGAPIDPDTAD